MPPNSPVGKNVDDGEARCGYFQVGCSVKPLLFLCRKSVCFMFNYACFDLIYVVQSYHLNSRYLLRGIKRFKNMI